MPDSGVNQSGSGRYPDTAPRADDPTQRTNEAVFREIEHLRELVQQKIDGIRAEVAAQKELTDAKFAASERNVTTAFTAAKEAVGKQEAAFKEQIAAIADTMNVQDRGRGAEIAALSKLVERSDARGGGFSSAGALAATAVGVIGTIVAIAAAIYAFGKP